MLCSVTFILKKSFHGFCTYEALSKVRNVIFQTASITFHDNILLISDNEPSKILYSRKCWWEKHWRIWLFKLFGRETLGNALQINKNGYRIFCKFERESFDNRPSILQICQFFLPPKFPLCSTCVEILELI